MTRKSSTMAGVLSSATSGVLSIIAGIVLLPMIVSTIGGSEYGVWLFVYAICSFAYYGDIGVGAAVVHFGSRGRGGDSRYSLGSILPAALLWTAAVTCLIVPVVYIISVSFVQQDDFDALITSTDRSMLLFCACSMAALVTLRPFNAALQARGDLVLERRFQLLGVVTRSALTPIACFAVGELWAVILAETLATVVPVALAAICILRSENINWRISKNRLETIRALLTFSSKSFAVSVVGQAIVQGGTLVLGVVGSPSQVTEYTAAYRIYSAARMASYWVNEPFRSTLSRLSVGSRNAVGKTTLYLVLFNTALTVLGAVLVALAGEGAIVLWLGTNLDTTVVYTAVVVMLCGLAVNSLHAPLSMAADAIGKPGSFFWIQTTWALIYFPVAFIWLGPTMGVLGVALAQAIPLFIIEPLYIWYSTRVLELKLSDWSAIVARPLLSFLAAPVAVAFTLGLWVGRTDSSLYPIIAVVIFLLSLVVAFRFSKSRLPLTSLSQTLRSKL